MKVLYPKSNPVEPLAETRTDTAKASLQETSNPENPEELLLALKAKQQLFSQLKEEGLIHKDQEPMSIKLAQTIKDLEVLISNFKEEV